jgi:uncharacterized protein (TIGR02001 family)
MPLASARLNTLIATLLVAAASARADVGATVSVQTDARDRGLSYSNNRPSAQLGLAWDGVGGWYAGAQLARVRFNTERSSRLQVYGGRVAELLPGLDGEVGAVAHSFGAVSHYDFQEVYAGLLGERWNLRLYHSPDYYGSRQSSLYGEFNLRWPLAQGVAALGHVGVLHGRGPQLPFLEPHGPTRVDQRLGLSWHAGAGSELQLAWVSASRGGPYTWIDATRRHTAVLSAMMAF